MVQVKRRPDTIVQREGRHGNGGEG